MENAVKAFYIAASVLIALMIASIMVYLFSAGARIGESHEQTQADQRLELFNAKFSIYSKDNNTISDLLTVINMAYDYNLKNEFDTVNSISIDVQISTGRILKVLPDANLEKNEIFLNDTSKKINTYDLLSKYLKDIKTIDGMNGLNASGLDDNTKLSDSMYTSGSNERLYRYYFKLSADNIKYSEKTGKINYMKFELDGPKY